MAAGDAIQVGVQYLIGTGYTFFQAYCVESVSYSKQADSNAHKDERGATDSILTQDPSTVIDAEFSIVGVATDFEPPDVDTLITMKGPDDEYFAGYRVVSSGTVPSSGIAKMSLSLIQEDSIGATLTGGEVTLADDWDISDDETHIESIIANGATTISYVYGNGTLLTLTTDYSVDVDLMLSIESTYIGTIIEDPADVLVLKICTNYGQTLTLTLTGIA